MKLSKKLTTVTPLSKRVAIILFAICLLAVIYFYKTGKTGCVNPYEVKDSTSGKETVRICNNAFYKGDIKIVDDKEYPDLFRFYLNKDSKPNKVVQYVRVFKENNLEFVSIVSFIDYASWNNSAIGIYKKTADGYSIIFKKGFADNQGRWVNIEFGEDSVSRGSYFYLSQKGEGFSISGDLGYLGCTGSCRMLWWDYYEWDSSKNMFVLTNNKHTEDFKKLLVNYEELDKATCLNEANLSESISALYPLRKNKGTICSDNSQGPFTTVGQAETLLKGMAAIKRIINGENISMSQVDKVKINL